MKKNIYFNKGEIENQFTNFLGLNDSLKKIIIGKQGQKLKKIGIEARKDLEQILDAKVYLELYVKTIEKWRDREKYLNEFKFTDFTE